MIAETTRRANDAAQDPIVTSIRAFNQQRFPARDSFGRLRPPAIDVKGAILCRDVLAEVAERFWREFRHLGEIQVASSDSLAASILGAILGSTEAPAKATGLVVRVERKQTGLSRLIEGRVSNAPCVIIDDILNSGQAAERLHSVLSSFGVRVIALFTVFSHDNPVAVTRMQRLELDSRYLVTRRDIGLGPVISEFSRSLRMPLELKWKSRASRPAYGLSPHRSHLNRYENFAIVSSPYGRISAFAVPSGTRTWSHSGHDHDEWPNLAEPVLREGSVLASGACGESMLFDFATGRPKWKKRFGDYALTTPRLRGDGRVTQLFSTCSDPQGSLVAEFDFESGEHETARQMRVRPTTDAIIWNGKLAFGTAERCIGLVDVGSKRTTLLKVNSDLVSGVTRVPGADSLLLFGADGGIDLLNANEPSARRIGRIAGALLAQPILHNGRLIISSGRTWLHCLDLANGRVLRSSRFAQGRLLAAAAAVGKHVIVGDTAGWLYLLDEELNAVSSLHAGEGVVEIESFVTGRMTSIVVLHSEGSLSCYELSEGD